MNLGETLSLVAQIAERYLVDKPYIVGGLPRDVYLKKEIKTTDVDLTTNSPDVLRLGILVANEMNATFELSDDGHLTAFTDSFDLDFSSNFISEGVVEYLGDKHQEYHEAYSRDFTINTLHQDLLTREIVDPTGQGFEDIKNKIIRTPVPPHITLEDDPRRIYRAVNLAARYGYRIDPTIVEFVLENPEIFSSENVKDKYISVKIAKALKEDAELTLHLLRELDLLKNVPLSGYFKDVLISKKLLVEYLGEEKDD
jgi:tRNA nucleotidyltransferase/poly(A) polymerase